MNMDRRDILKLGTAAAISGCASGPRAGVPAAGPMSDSEVEDALADLDRTLASLASTPARPDLYAKVLHPGEQATLPPLDGPRTEEANGLLKRMFAALHIAATFRELPAEVQAREDTQRRMWRAMPLLDGAVTDMAGYMSSLSSKDRRKIQAEINRDPDLVMNIVGTLDEQAAHVGVPLRRRAQLRTAGANVAWRMSKQGVDVLVGEMLGKVERVSERLARDEETRRAMAAKIAQAELFGPKDDPTAHLILSAQITATAHARREGRVSTVLTVGGVLFGVGAVLGIGGALLLSGGEFAGAFVLTFAVIFGVAGLVMLLVGAILAASVAGDDVASDDAK